MKITTWCLQNHLPRTKNCIWLKISLVSILKLCKSKILGGNGKHWLWTMEVPWRSYWDILWWLPQTKPPPVFYLTTKLGKNLNAGLGFNILIDGNWVFLVTFVTWDPSDVWFMKRQKYEKTKRQRPKREFCIVMSGQFRTLAMFLNCPAVQKRKDFNFYGNIYILSLLFNFLCSSVNQRSWRLLDLQIWRLCHFWQLKWCYRKRVWWMFMW